MILCEYISCFAHLFPQDIRLDLGYVDPPRADEPSKTGQAARQRRDKRHIGRSRFILQPEALKQ